MKILIICAAGMSSSLIVNKMKKIAPEGTIIDCNVGGNTIQGLKEYDVLLVGPQLRFKKEEIEKEAKKVNVPYGFIDMVQYGRAMAEEIYAQAVELYKEKRKKG